MLHPQVVPRTEDDLTSPEVLSITCVVGARQLQLETVTGAV